MELSKPRLRDRSARYLLAVICLLAALAACAPRQPYYRSLPPRSVAPPPPLPAPPTQATETPSPPVWQEARTREPEALSRPPVGEPPRHPGLSREPVAPQLPDDSSLIAKIGPATAPRRAASLRLTDEGRRLIEAGDYAKALNRLEKTIAIDSTNGYGYYYLAKAHYHQGKFQDSLNFLDVAESRLVDETYWLAEVYALRGENYRGLGFVQRAESNYVQALRLNSGNRVAAEALARMQSDTRPVR